MSSASTRAHPTLGSAASRGLGRFVHGSALLLVLAGCRPELVWYGHTSDRARRLEIRQYAGAEWLRDEQRESKRYDAIPTHALIRSDAGGRVAFAGVRHDGRGRERWHAVVDLVEGPPSDGIAGLRFDASGRHVAYAAERAGRWHAVVDGREGPAWESLDLDSLTFSPDGARYAYVAYDGACQRVIVEQHVGSCRGAVRGLALANHASQDVVIASDPDAAALSWVTVGGARQLSLSQAVLGLFSDPAHEHWAVNVAGDEHGARAHLVQDGRLLPDSDEIGHVVFSPDGRTLAYTAREQRAWFAVIGRQRGPAYRTVEAPVFSADSRRYGYIARSETESDVVLDGKVRWRVPTPTATALAFSPDGTRVAFVYQHARGPVVVVDDAAFRFDVIVEQSLRFDRHGRHWAMLAGELGRRELFIVIDGRQRLAFDTTELFGGGLGAGDAVELLGRWVRAELERFLRHHEA